MTLIGWLQIIFFVALTVAVTKPLGVFMYDVFEGEKKPLSKIFGPAERIGYRVMGVDPHHEQTWVEYTIALLLFSAFSLLVTSFIQRLQQHLPLNPQGLGAVGPELAFNTAVSFTTNTNWQSYAGE